MEEEYNSQKRVSRYNSAMLEIERMDRIWQKCYDCRTRGKLLKWNDNLDSAFLELSASSNVADLKKIKKINEYLIKNISNKAVLYQILIKKEQILRKIQDEQGKGSAYDDGSEDDFD